MAFQSLTIECKGCGASVSLDPAFRSGVCPYCGSSNTLKITGPEAEQFPAVQHIFPARISEESFKNAVRAFLCSDPDVPDSLYETLEAREMVLTFMPFYKHRIDWSSNWTADIGYDDEENNGKISWQGTSGQTNGVSEVYSPGSSYLLSRDFGFDCCLMAAKSGEQPLQFQVELLEGISYLRCDVDADAGEKEFTMEQLDVLIHNESIDNVPGDYQKNFHYTHRIHDRSATLQLIPFWLFVYEWNGETYYCLQDASSGEIKGTLPTTSKRKVTSWILTAVTLLILSFISFLLWKLRSPYDAAFFASLTYPVIGAGLVYREIIAFKKSKIKFANESIICDELQKIKKFEANFITKACTFIGIWIAAAIVATFAIALLLPIWCNPKKPLPPIPPERPGIQEQSKVIKLKKKKVENLIEEVSDDDGNAFVIEK